MTRYISVASVADIPAKTCKSIEVEGQRVILAHLGDGFHAVEDRCSHAGWRLDCGRIYDGGLIACPVHGAMFDLRNGAAKSPPAFFPLAVFPVRVTDGQIEVALPEPRST
jgi:3-phenylpropionate/trans-cinnamate dioxygenase ferredoxin subunit